MSKKKRKGKFDSEGHRLIAELQLHLGAGRPLFHETKEAWTRILWEIYISNNKEEAAAKFVDLLGLEFERGRPAKNPDTIPLWVELLILDEGTTKDKAYELLEAMPGMRGKKKDTIEGLYNKYRSDEMREYATILYQHTGSWKDGPKVGTVLAPAYPELFRADKAFRALAKIDFSYK